MCEIINVLCPNDHPNDIRGIGVENEKWTYRGTLVNIYVSGQKCLGNGRNALFI